MKFFLLVALTILCLTHCDGKPRRQGENNDGQKKLKNRRNKPKGSTVSPVEELPRTNRRSALEAVEDGDAGPRKRKKRRSQSLNSASSQGVTRSINKESDWGFVFSWHQNRIRGIKDTDYRFDGHKPISAPTGILTSIALYQMVQWSHWPQK